MMHHRPPLFVNSIPVNPNGMTLVDLEEMDEGVEVTRTHHSSKPSVSRHGSPFQGLDEVSDGASDVSALSVSHEVIDNSAMVS